MLYRIIMCGLTVLLTSGCYTGLNYNQGATHNDSLSNRERIVRKQDAYAKAQMIKSRKKAVRHKGTHKKSRTHKKYI